MFDKLEWQREWRRKNPRKYKERKRIDDRNYYLRNTEKIKEHHHSYHQRTWDDRYEKKGESIRARSREWKKLNPGKQNANTAMRAAIKLQATPKWLTREQIEEIKQFYINCPKGYQVDHIYPLRSKIVCGLHVPWNLQYLPAKENLKKGNRLIREDPDLVRRAALQIFL